MITTDLDPATGTVLHMATGRIDVREIAEALLRFDPVDGPRRISWNLNAAEIGDFFCSDIGLFVTVSTCAFGKIPGCRMAWILPFGVTSTMLNIALEPLRAAGIEYRIFDAPDPARKWLAGDVAAQPGEGEAGT